MDHQSYADDAPSTVLVRPVTKLVTRGGGGSAGCRIVRPGLGFPYLDGFCSTDYWHDRLLEFPY